jgi:hypothetical protein
MGYIVSGQAGGALSGLLHVWLDQECSKDPCFKRWLEFSAKKDAEFNKEMAHARRIQKSLAKRKR